jgi:hypothetical protein
MEGIMDIKKLNDFMNTYGKSIMLTAKDNGVEINIVDNMVESSEIYFIPNPEKIEDVLNEIIDKYPFPIC